MACAPNDDQPGHPPSLIRLFAVRSVGSQGPQLSSCGQRKLWSDWADGPKLSSCGQRKLWSDWAGTRLFSGDDFARKINSFLRGNMRNIIHLSSAEFAQRVIKVKCRTPSSLKESLVCAVLSCASVGAPYHFPTLLFNATNNLNMY